jgi:acyl-CoA synthetase (AMP-forming)/AMP-acid ligase II
MVRADTTLIHEFLENSARMFPDKCALVQDGHRASYREINAAANELANWMVSAEVRSGDRIVILLANCLEYVISYYSTLKAGAVAVPLNPELKEAGLEPIIRSLDPKIVILSKRQYDSTSRESSERSHDFCWSMEISRNRTVASKSG